jgi:indolepyruvate ferredoxin oxidoreductase beta subunit
MKNEITDILIVGVGGQGTLLTSRVLARAVVDAGYDVKVSEVHGMAQRGGSVVTQVRFGQQVFSPLVSIGGADVILAFEPVEGARWLPYLKPGGTIIINDEPIDPLPVLSGQLKYPKDIAQKVAQLAGSCQVVACSELAEKIGNRRAANVVMVGILTRLLALPRETVEAALVQVVPPRTLAINQEAFRQGWALLA